MSPDIKVIWHIISGYPKYKISNEGDIYSIKNNIILKLNTDRYGYRTIILFGRKGGKSLKVHRLVGIAFIPNPKNKPMINHIDGDKANNFVRVDPNDPRKTNLEWNTRSENQRHAIRTGLQKVLRGSKHPASKADSIKVLRIRRLSQSGYTQAKIAKIVKLDQGTVSRILKNKSRGRG